MDYLARREYGHDELVKKLATAGFETAVAADVVAILRSDGLQSDERFTNSFIQSRISLGKGPVRIRQELKERGIRSELVGVGIDDTDADWYALAIGIRVRKFGSDLPVDFKEKARQMRFLQYRGFEQDHIQTAVANTGS
ncbi:MAG: regulatory protein RecX [Woeseia sp.]|nr:regulatory protein RecX [Woeseia sp.]